MCICLQFHAAAAACLDFTSAAWLEKMAENDSKVTSQVWNYFQLIDTHSWKKTHCQLCDIGLAYQSSCTKFMWNHFRAKHEKNWLKIKWKVVILPSQVRL